MTKLHKILADWSMSQVNQGIDMLRARISILQAQESEDEKESIATEIRQLSPLPSLLSDPEGVAGRQRQKAALSKRVEEVRKRKIQEQARLEHEEEIARQQKEMEAAVAAAALKDRIEQQQKEEEEEDETAAAEQCVSIAKAKERKLAEKKYDPFTPIVNGPFDPSKYGKPKKF